VGDDFCLLIILPVQNHLTGRGAKAFSQNEAKRVSLYDGKGLYLLYSILAYRLSSAAGVVEVAPIGYKQGQSSVTVLQDS
jgi:hypothetical protein